MAKLIAHGKELARVRKHYTFPQDNESCIIERVVTIAYMEDGVVLRKRNSLSNLLSDDNGRGKWITDGWKKLGKLKAGVTLEQAVQYELDHGFERIS